jgi:transglutaminase-like putative cysteine protease
VPTPTPKPTPRPTPTRAPATATPSPAPASDFPAKDYGTFFRDNYGRDSNLVVSDDGGITIDTGSTPYGVVLIKIDGIPADKRCKVIVSASSAYQYDILSRGKFVGLPLQMGSGSYTISVYEQVSGSSYAAKMAHSFSVDLASSLKPYLAASIMSDFSRSSALVSKADSLTSGISTQNGRVEAVYKWIVANIDYDRVLAGSITSGEVSVYVPDPNKTYSSRKGICFDYASLMCAMLRSQGIPTRLIVGSTSLGYHAWNEVYFAGTGWVVVASFSWKKIDGSGWVLFDTTFAAGGMSPEKIQSTTHTKQKTY